MKDIDRNEYVLLLAGVEFIQKLTIHFEQAYDVLEEIRFYNVSLTGSQYYRHSFEHVYRDPHEDRNMIMLHGRYYHGGVEGISMSDHALNIEVLTHFSKWYDEKCAERDNLKVKLKERKDFLRKMQQRENGRQVERRENQSKRSQKAIDVMRSEDDSLGLDDF